MSLTAANQWNPNQLNHIKPLDKGVIATKAKAEGKLKKGMSKSDITLKRKSHKVTADHQLKKSKSWHSTKMTTNPKFEELRNFEKKKIN